MMIKKIKKITEGMCRLCAFLFLPQKTDKTRYDHKL